MSRIAALFLIASLIIISCNSSSNKPKSDKPTSGKDTVGINPSTPDEPMMDTTEYEEPDTTAVRSNNENTDADMRIGYINSLRILDKMPELKTADQQLQQYAQQLDQEIQRRQQALQQKYDQYAKDTTASQAIMEMRITELQQMQQQLYQLQYSSEQDLAKQKDELYKPILAKIDRAIKRVAKREGFTHVLDTSGGALVYGEDRFDLTEQVMGALGI